MPKPSVALWSAKPTIRVAASETSPEREATPIARPSAKLWSPIAMAIIIPSDNAARRACSASPSPSNVGSAIASALPPDTGGSGRRRCMTASTRVNESIATAKPPSSSAL